MSNRRIKLTVLVSHPIQYFDPVYRTLAQREDLDITVLYRTRVGVDSYYDEGFGQSVQWDIPLLRGYRSFFLSKKSNLGGIEWSIIRYLTKQHPDVLLLHGYNHPTNLLALLVAKICGIRVLMRGDTRIAPHHGKVLWKMYLKRQLFRMIDGCVSIGSLNRKYYETLGVPTKQIYFAPFCIDSDFFDLDVTRPIVREAQRQALSIKSDAKVVLFASKLVEQKRPMDLILSMSSIKDTYQDVVLIVAGSGPEEHVLRKMAKTKKVDVRFVGFKNQTEMPELFAASDLFVLPSHNESWGLVVNEAMAAGLPVIVSDDVGAAVDLVEGKETGLVYPVGDIGRLTGALELLLKSPETMQRMGHNARTLIKQWSVSASAEGLARAVHEVARSGIGR